MSMTVRDDEVMKCHVRLTRTVKEELNKLTKIRALSLGMKQITYSQFLKEVLQIVGPWVCGEEFYVVGDNVYTDNAEAWGAAMQATAKGQPTKPLVMICVGEDERFDVPWETETA